ncbi:MAG: hypothetical protein LBJ07_01230 [Actinomycetes bacterium]|jgi:hypothetical protein|nr:hypothetical protein [Actinomycetes bacterium]
MKYSFTEETLVEEGVTRALRNQKVRHELADALGCDRRALREHAAKVFVEVSQRDAKVLQPFETEIIDALDRPESLTRYSMLDVLTEICRIDARVVTNSAFEVIEDCLYDEDSGTVRLSDFRLFCVFGATTPTRSLKVWEDLSMAIRCYHGDAEFIPMLNELLLYLNGKVDHKVHEQATELFAFDAENAKGVLKRKAEAIVAFAPEVIERLKAEAAAREREKAEEARKTAEVAARAAAEADEAADAAEEGADDTDSASGTDDADAEGRVIGADTVTGASGTADAGTDAVADADAEVGADTDAPHAGESGKGRSK